MEKTKAAQARKDIRAAFEIPETDFVILFVGRLFERKRPLDVLALSEILAANKKVQTIIVGNGPMEEELTAKAKENPRIHMAGFRNQEEMRGFYFACDLLVVPSEYETWGLVVNEAFACGLPAAVTDTCGSAEDLVVNGVTGLVFPVGKIDPVAAFVVRWANDRDGYEAIRNNARTRVNSEYRTDQFAKVMSDAFTTVTKNARNL